jgi:hypothetical protein
MMRERLEDDFKSWEARSDNWVKTEGERFGLGLDPDATPGAPGEGGGAGQARPDE